MILTEAEVRVACGVIVSITDAERAVLSLVHPLAEGAVKSYLGYDPEYKAHVEFYPRLRTNDRERTADGMGWEVLHNRAVLVDESSRGDLQLLHLPVRDVTEIRVDWDGRAGQRPGSFGDDTLFTKGDQYWLDLDQDNLCKSGLVLSVSLWPTTPGSIKVSYLAGYSTAELSGRAASSINASPIKEATLMAVSQAMRDYMSSQKGRAGWVAGRLASERLGEYSYQLDGSGTAATSSFQIQLPPGAQQRLQAFRHFGLQLL